MAKSAIEERRQRNAGKVVPIHPGAREAYRMAPDFVRAIAVHAAGHAGRNFFLSIGHAVDPDLLEPRAKTVFEIARVVRAESGNPPGNITTTIQRLARQLHDGKITVEHYEAVVDYITDFDDAKLPDAEETAAQLRAVVVPQIIQQHVAPAAIAAIASGDVRAARKQIELVERVKEGRAEAKVGGDWEEADEVGKAMGALPRLATGLPLDVLIAGGIKRGIVTNVIAGTGVGKSPSLVHFGCEALAQGLFVVHVSLQDPEWVVRARYKANLLDAPYVEMEADPDRGTRLLREVFPELGRFRLRELPGGVATPQDCFDAIDAEEQRAGRSIDVFVCDYPGRLRPPAKAVSDGDKQYVGIEAVAALFEMYCWGTQDKHGHKGGPIWMFEGQQERRRSGGEGTRSVENAKKRPVTTDDGAGGMGTTRDAGFVLSLQRAVEGDEIEGATLIAHVAKNKLGPWGVTAQLRPNLAHARIHYDLPHRDRRRKKEDLL